jgi:hypothetical protein
MAGDQMIVWLEDPRQWRYLRESTMINGSRRGWKRGAKLPLADFYKLVGYKLEGRHSPYWFLYTIYWLKTHDAGCPEGNKEYGYHHTGSQPCEARNVSDLLAVQGKGNCSGLDADLEETKR